MYGSCLRCKSLSIFYFYLFITQKHRNYLKLKNQLWFFLMIKLLHKENSTTLHRMKSRVSLLCTSNPLYTLTKIWETLTGWRRFIYLCCIYAKVYVEVTSGERSQVWSGPSATRTALGLADVQMKTVFDDCDVNGGQGKWNRAGRKMPSLKCRADWTDAHKTIYCTVAICAAEH